LKVALALVGLAFFVAFSFLYWIFWRKKHRKEPPKVFESPKRCQEHSLKKKEAQKEAQKNTQKEESEE